MNSMQHFDKQLLNHVVDGINKYIADKRWTSNVNAMSKEEIKETIIEGCKILAGYNCNWCNEEYMQKVSNKTWDFIPEVFVYLPPDLERCDCGAKHTSFPNFHMDKCQSMKEEIVIKVDPGYDSYHNRYYSP